MGEQKKKIRQMKGLIDSKLNSVNYKYLYSYFCEWNVRTIKTTETQRKSNESYRRLTMAWSDILVEN